jgi:hypothetical protein
LKYLTIDRTMSEPIRMVVDNDTGMKGNTQMLEWQELKDYARWLGVAGGRELLDAFEVKLINDGMLWYWPVDADGEPLHDDCDALEIRHYDEGSRIAWQPKLKCNTCCGNGHFNLHGEPVGEDDLCLDCDGIGWRWGEEFETDMQGNCCLPNVGAERRP